MLRYEHGVPGEPDFEAAVKWYAKAVGQGERFAAFRLALIYHYGRGVLGNPLISAKGFTKAAEAGLVEPQFNLWHLFERGLRLAPGGDQAVVWYNRAAMQGITEAYRRFGMFYAVGGLTIRANAKASFWFPLMDNRPEIEDVRKLVRKRGGTAADATKKLGEEWRA